MFVTAMEKYQRFVCRPLWNPGAVEQFGAVPARKSLFSGLHLLGAIR